jgi:hypothetical protein
MISIKADDKDRRRAARFLAMDYGTSTRRPLPLISERRSTGCP